jgi:hypothetical protein
VRGRLAPVEGHERQLRRPLGVDDRGAPCPLGRPVSRSRTKGTLLPWRT